MKCPFRTKKIIKHTISDNPFNASYRQRVATEMHTDFEDCIETDCPWYGKEVIKYNTYGEGRKSYLPVCRRVEGGHEK